jgi:Flp pilus assembly secretin CpaC
MDQARVIGNPLIADVSIQPGGLTVITGKSYGATNFIATDKRGAVLLEKAIEVSGPRDRTVVMYNGAERQTYSCTPDCSRRLTLGDTPDSFDKTLSEITSLNAQATAAGALSSGQIQLDSRSVGTNNSKQQQQ